MNIISGKFRGRKLLFPKDKAVMRPTKSVVREAVFNIFQNQIEGAHFLDVYAGTGAMGLEALSRGAAEVLFIDVQTNWISQNLKALGAEGFVLKMEAEKSLNRLEHHEKRFEIIWLDPPYAQAKAANVIEAYFHSEILVPGGFLVFEHSARFQIPADILKFRIKERRFGNTMLSVFQKGHS